MTRSVNISRGAAADIAEAHECYEAKQAGLGDDFLNALAKVFDRLEAGPQKYPVAIKDSRRALMSQFPYSEYFRTTQSQIKIVAVIHQHRDPRIARQRLR